MRNWRLSHNEDPNTPTRGRTRRVRAHSLILARISESLKRKYSYTSNILGPGISERECEQTSSPTFIEFPPQLGSSTRSPAFTLGVTSFPFLSWMPGPTAMTVASGRLPEVAEVGKNNPEAVFCNELDEFKVIEDEERTVSGLNR
jgi:hypothetical protein